MYSLKKIQNHAHILSFLVKESPELFSKVVPLPKTNSITTKICSLKEWKVFKRETTLGAKDLEDFIRFWKSDLEYSATVSMELVNRSR